MGKILFIDIETTPLISYTWGMFEQNIIDIKNEWFILSVAYKWLGEKKVNVISLPDFKLYKKDKTNDKELLKKVWELLDESSVIVAHNGAEFDLKKLNARFIFHKMNSPSPYKVIDTLKEAKKYFSFTNNKLDYLSKFLNLGEKLETGGFSLWLQCMAGDMKAWKRLKAYNKNDIILLEKLYLLFRPWIANHPNKALMDGKERACPTCSSEKIQSRGFSYTKTGTYRRWQCTNCGAWSQSVYREKNLSKVFVK